MINSTPFVPTTINDILTPRNIIGDRIIKLHDAQKIRLALLVTQGCLNTTPIIPTITNVQTIQLLTELKKIGYTGLNQTVQVGNFLTKLFNLYGLNVDRETLITTYNYEKKISWCVFELLCLPFNKVVKVSKTGQVVDKGKYTITNKVLYRYLINWLKTYNTTVLPVNTPVIHIFAVTPSLREDKMKLLNTTSFGTVHTVITDRLYVQDYTLKTPMCVAYENRLVMHQNLDYETYANMVRNELVVPNVSKPIFLDIDTTDHKIPFTRIMLDLVKQSVLDINTIRWNTDVIRKIFAFGYEYGFCKVVETIAKINGNNPKISQPANTILEVAVKGFTPEIVNQFETLATTVYDDHKIDTTKELVLAGVMTQKENEYGLPMPNLTPILPVF